MLTRSLRLILCTVTCISVVLVSEIQAATASSQSPTSKIFVSDLRGESQVTLDGIVVLLEKKSVFSAQGAIIETKANSTNSLVYSNGTGIFLGENSRLELRRFAQEPFAPNRVDLETEPSISQTEVFLARGSVALCTSRMVAGSSMVYQTPLAIINVRGKRVVIESGDEITKVSVLEGDCSVRAGERDAGGRTVSAGEQAIFRRGPADRAHRVEVIKISDGERQGLEEKTAMACLARQTVFFDVRDGTANSGTGERTQPLDITPGNLPPNPTLPNLPLRPEIIPVEVVPGTLPVDFTVSPSRI